MKVAILLRGSSINTYEHWQFKEQVSVNYKNNIDNLKTNLLNNYDCDVFFHTWKEADRDDVDYEQTLTLKRTPTMMTSPAPMVRS